MPFAGGKIDPAEAGRKGAEARWRAPAEAAEADEEPASASGPLDLLAEMEALLQRPKSQDRGESQKGLRNWYETDLKGFMGHLAGLKREQMRAAGKGEGPEDEPEERDEGTENALAVLERVLKEIREEMDTSDRIGAEVAHAWGKMTAEARQAVLNAAGIPHSVVSPDGRPAGGGGKR